MIERILAFDTSTENLGLALWLDGAVMALHQQLHSPKHTEHLLPAIHSFLSQNNVAFDTISAVACCRGPGSFTGLRVGLAAAKAIAVAREIPLITVPTLSALMHSRSDSPALQSSNRGLYLPILDARKRRFYGQFFQASDTTAGRDSHPSYRELSPPLDESAENMLARARGFLGAASPLHVVGAAAGVFAERVPLDQESVLPDSLRYQDTPLTAVAGLALLAGDRYGAGDWDPPGQGLEYVRMGDIGGRRSKSTFIPDG